MFGPIKRTLSFFLLQIICRAFKESICRRLGNLIFYAQIIRRNLYPHHCRNQKWAICHNGSAWFDDIKMFLKDDNSLDSVSLADKRTLRNIACHFFRNGETLRCVDDEVLLRCLDASEANRITSEIMTMTIARPMWTPHERIYASQENLKTMTLLVTMDNDCFKHVHMCHLCQIYTDKIN